MKRLSLASTVPARPAPARSRRRTPKTFPPKPSVPRRSATPSYGPGLLPGTALAGHDRSRAIGNDPTPGRGNYLDLFSGWYSSNFSNVTNLGSTTVVSVAAFDLLAGYTYTLSFDYSRQTFSAGNGPFDTSLIGSLGSHSVTYNDVAGFYYGFDWQRRLTWTQGTDELGAHVTFTAFGPGGYSGMAVDNISMVGLPPAVITPVPEPGTVALLAGGWR